ncbi:MAG: FHA domain-containing protein [Chloroflexi bacterium]|nr:FHA domain-containing protein [Chloroflexota bacterium]MBP7044318.1 FHA domain-containing protein [Chloroflexota bacterium]
MPDVDASDGEPHLKIPSGGIGFSFGDHEPIIRQSADSFILGRYGPSSITSSAFVDLMNYDAANLGVSRSHARISFVDNAFVVEDLDSTNGSWLNDVKLISRQNYPLHNNDRLMLGRLMMRVHLGERPSPNSVTFSLQNESLALTDGQQLITLAALETDILPYLAALERLQQTLDASVQRPSPSAAILSLTADPDNTLTIQADGLAEAVAAIRARVSPWRSLRQEIIGSAPNTIDPVIYQSVIQVTANILLDHNPAMSQDEKFSAVENLTPHMLLIALNPFTLTL